MMNIILCGGSGTRVWPVSRKSSPKQFCKLVGDTSLFKKTILRNLAACDRAIAVTNKDHYFLCRRQVEETEGMDFRFVVEPMGRGTAGAIALACLAVDADEIILVTPSDHQVTGFEDYAEQLRAAEELARKGLIVTFGIRPAYPETGFGYLQVDGQDVLAFREKPDLETAKSLIESPNTYWNSGMFCFRAGIYLAELLNYAPDIYHACETAYQNAANDGHAMHVGAEDMQRIPVDSIDCAVMEKTTRLKMLPASFNWTDLGSFDSLYAEMEKDAEDNAIRGDVLAVNSSGNLAMSGNRLVALVGVDDLIVVDTQDALLVTKKGRSQEVRQAVALLEARDSGVVHGREEPAHMRGSCTILQNGGACTIKRVSVHRGSHLSLHPRAHHEEHWIVAGGTALLELEGGQQIMLPARSSYAPEGNVRRLVNAGDGELTIIVTEFTGSTPARNEKYGECAWLSSLAS